MPKLTLPRLSARSSRPQTEPSVAHPHALVPLVGLALGLDRGGHHQLGLLELLDRRVAGRGHRGGERAEEIERAIVLVRRSHEYLLEGGDLLGPNASSARERRMERGHAPGHT